MRPLLILGDLLLDIYTWGDAERISPEAPVPVIQVDREECRLGGAASVARLSRGLEAEVLLAGVIGNDLQGQTLRQQLVAEGIDASLVLDDFHRCTTTKQRLVGRAANRHPHQMVRIDREVREPLSPELDRRLTQAVCERIPECSAVLIADYGKGVCTGSCTDGMSSQGGSSLLRAALETAGRHHVPVLVDPARGTEWSRYRGAAVVKPNRGEAEQAVGRRFDSVGDAVETAEQLRLQADLPALLLTLDCDGLILARDGEQPEHVSTRPRSVYDITGAGDMALAMLGWCFANDKSWDETLALINAAAGLEVERFGVAPVSWPEIRAELSGFSHTPRAKLIDRDELAPLGKAYRGADKRVVFTNGCFDLLHVGHVTVLQQAAELGDVLVVGINSDASVRRLKGAGRPVINERDRAMLLSALGCVTHVVVFDDATPHDLLHRLQPDVLVKGGTYRIDEVVGHEVVRAYGGDVRVVGCVEGVSTTRILAGLRSTGSDG